MKSERIFIKKTKIDLPEDGYPQRSTLGFWKSLSCILFHRVYHYIFRIRTYDNDWACNECRVQWIS